MGERLLAYNDFLKIQTSKNPNLATTGNLTNKQVRNPQSTKTPKSHLSDLQDSENPVLCKKKTTTKKRKNRKKKSGLTIIPKLLESLLIFGKLSKTRRKFE